MNAGLVFRKSPWRSGLERAWKCSHGVRSATRRMSTRLASIQGPNEPPLLRMTIPEHFRSVASDHGDRTAIISRHQNRRLTYEQLHLESDALARGLLELGVKKGDRCAVCLGNNIEFAVLTYALFKLGAILVPLNPAFTSNQVISALTHLDAAYLFISTETRLPYKPPISNISLLKAIVPNIESSSQIHSEAVPTLKSVVLINNSSLIDPSHLKAAISFHALSLPGPLPTQNLQPTDPINIQFTSGTTSLPKAAALSHINILNNGYSIGSRLRLSPADIVICPPPLFHCFGSVLGYMATATHGAAIGFPAESFDPQASVDMVREERATALYGVPTMFVAELELLDRKKAGLENLRTGIAAGSSVPATLMGKLHERMNLKELTICYGMTETSPVSCMTATDDPLVKRLETVGKPLPHVRVKVVQPGDWTRTLNVGERGELVVSGYLVMNGYWGDETRTREVLKRDGDGRVWMLTGDEALIDEDGYVRITGRIKDLIIRGGENIHPLEIENVLLSHPSVSDVSVVGLPDEKYGECVAAFVIKKEGSDITEEGVREWVRERLSRHLVPRWVVWVDSFPKTASGKVMKFKLREIGEEMLKFDTLR